MTTQLTKTVKSENNWVAELDSLSVEQAIAYLNKFNQSDRLYVDSDDDKISSYITFTVALTEEEIAKRKQDHHLSKIKEITYAISFNTTQLKYSIKNNRTNQVRELTDKINELQNQLDSINLTCTY